MTTKNKTTYILTFIVDYVEKETATGFNGKSFKSYDDLYKEVSKNIKIEDDYWALYTVPDFVTACNEQDIEVVDSLWMSYVTIEEDAV